MSYTNLMKATRTAEHHIAPNPAKDETYVDAQGNGMTAQALKKVANFIGMNDARPHEGARGYISADLKQEKAARQDSFRQTALVESAELDRRSEDYFEYLTSKVMAGKMSEMILAWHASKKTLRPAHERIESWRFVRSLHERMRAIEQCEQERRIEDYFREDFKQKIAADLSNAISMGIIAPKLRPVTHGSILDTVDRATTVAHKTVDSFLSSMAQIGRFAVAATRFLGHRAADKAHRSFDDVFTPSSLSWSQLSLLEDAERSYRLNECAALARFMLAWNTSSLVVAHFAKLESDSTCAERPSNATAVLTEMERARREAQHRVNPTARLNALRAAAAVKAHQRQLMRKQFQLVKPTRFEYVDDDGLAPPAKPQVRFASPMAVTKSFRVEPTKRAIPQVAGKRYNYVRERSHESLTGPAAM